MGCLLLLSKGLSPPRDQQTNLPALQADSLHRLSHQGFHITASMIFKHISDQINTLLLELLILYQFSYFCFVAPEFVSFHEYKVMLLYWVAHIVFLLGSADHLDDAWQPISSQQIFISNENSPMLPL